MNPPLPSGPAASASPPAEECDRCLHRGSEYYWYLGLYEFDVERARELVADGREAVEVDEESVRVSVRDSVIHDGHIDHVDPRFPGIIAHVFFQTGEGEPAHGHVLIDGNHRAARCLRDGLPFFAHVLSEDESRAILLLSPERKADEPAAAHHQ